jgi:hypothetical protein
MCPAGMEFKLGRGKTPENERKKQPTNNRVLSESIMGKNLAQASQAAPPPAAAAACHKSGQREEDEEEQ